jgi:hypothetical protein
LRLLSTFIASAWALGTLSLLASAISRALFSRRQVGNRLAHFAHDLLFALIWPFGLFSAEGWRFITKNIREWY